MNTSRKYEIQKKRLAVRRLSQGSRGKVPSPQGEGRFTFKPRLSPEDYATQKRRVPSRPRTGYQNQGTWSAGDLRGKLNTRSQKEDFGQGQDHEENSDVTNPFKTVLSTATTVSDASAQFNPFAAVLQPNSSSIFSKHIDKSKKIFGASLNEQKSLTEKDSNEESSPFYSQKPVQVPFPLIPSKTFQPSSVESNPFLMALKGKGTSSNIKPLATNAVVPSSSAPKAAPPGSSKNPFSSALMPFSSKGAATVSETSAILPTTSDTSPASIFTQEKSLIAELTSLRLKGVPVELNTKEFLRGYYEKFGSVKRVYSHPASKSAIISFIDHDSAARAKKTGTVLTGGTTVGIFWNQHTSKPQSSQIASNNNKETQEAPDFTEASRISDDKIELRQDTIARHDGALMSYDSSGFAAMIENFVNPLKSVPARSSLEKGEMLERIDQKIREGMKTETDLRKASHFVGTCPDMCPEKERYLREHQQRLATYETRNGIDDPDARGGQYPVVDPSKVVKEYSRSSADQEKPLPHELRPGHVLQLTMNYLMLHVMDSGDRNWAEWYDFVWNRTRGIRKDITQQHLCDESSVDLIEKCTRFHIICSHHLCEEDINVFDPKINNEHLTKCLQSLKHMYEDLHLKKGIICPNEAEFRCYQILLNLNNGDILREITEFRHEVRESQEVKFALEVLRALNSTNYVRFFKLLHSGSYLMACIMQRYFNQIRSTGLFIMNKAYTSTGVRSVPIPLSDIARLFAIDELDEASEFCSHYGFQVDEGMVYFSKSSYEEPESNFLPVRNGIIDKKRNSSFGEVVNGKPLPKQCDYLPTSSFDANGHYNGNYHTLALRGILSDRGADMGKTVPIGEKALSHPMRVGKDDIKAMCLAIIIPVVNKEVYKMCTDAMEDVKEAITTVNEASDNIIDNCVRTEVQICLETEIEKEAVERLSRNICEDLSRSVVEEQIKAIAFQEFEAEKARRDHDRRMLLFQLATEMSRDLLREFVGSSIDDVAHEVIRLERHELKMQMIAQQCQIVSRECLEGFLSKEVRDICRKSKELEMKCRKEKLEHVKLRMLTIRKRKIFKRWIKEKAARMHIRDTLHRFPACSPLQPSPEMIRSLTRHVGHASKLPSYVTLKNNVELTVSSVSNTAKTRDRHRSAIEKYHQRIINTRHDLRKPFDFTSALQFMAKLLKTNSRTSLYSKLLVCFPGSKKSSPVNSFDVDVINDKFKSTDFESDGREGSNSLVQNFCDLSASIPQGVISLSIKGLADCYSNEEKIKIANSKELYGVSGVICIAEMQKINWLSYQKTLKDIFTLKPNLPSCPMLFIGLNGSFTKREVNEHLQFEKFKENGDISSYEIVLLDSKMNGADLHEELFACLLKLISETPERPKLQCSSLPNLLEDALQLNFFERLYKGRIMQRDLKNPVFNPNPIVDLYNKVLDYVLEICTCKRLLEYSWPSKQMLQHNKNGFPDLTWNDQGTFIKLKNVMNSLRLPAIDYQIDPNGDWDEQVRYCLEYLHSILKNVELNLHSSEMISRVECVINKYLQKWKYRSIMTPLPFPWSLILEECVHVLLASIHRPQSDVEIPRMVCFFKKDFYNFKPPNSWIDDVRFIKNISVTSDTVLSPTLNLSSREDYIQQTLREHDDDFSCIENSLSRSNLNNSHADESVDDLLQKQKLLDESLSKERTEWSRLSDFCATSSVDDPVYISSGFKRKRLVSEDPSSRERKGVRGLRKENELGWMDTEKKRVKKDLESRIDDLLNEVNSMRSQFDLDKVRYHHAIDT